MTEHDDIKQAVAISSKVSTKGIKLKNIYKYNDQDLSGVIKIIDKFKPDVFVQYTSSRYFAKECNYFC